MQVQIDGLRNDISAMNAEVAGVRLDMRAVVDRLTAVERAACQSACRDDVIKLKRVIFEGNGDDSLMSRLAVANQRLDTLVAWKLQSEEEARQSRRDMRGAVRTAVFSLAVSGITAIIATAAMWIRMHTAMQASPNPHPSLAIIQTNKP